MFERLRPFNRMKPYLRANTRALALGGAALLTANFLDVQVLTALGNAIDMLNWDLGPFHDRSVAVLRASLLSIAALALCGAIARFFMRWLIVGASREIEFAYRNDLFARLQHLSPSFFTTRPTGDIMARSTTDIEAVRLVIGPAIMYLAGSFTLLPFSLYRMIEISPSLTLATWTPLLLLMPLFYFFSARIHTRFALTQGVFSDISTRVQEFLTGIRVIKAYAREEQEADRFADLSAHYVAENIRLTRLQAFFIPLMQLIIGLGLLALVAAGGAMIARGVGGVAGAGGSAISQGSLISFFVLLMANVWPLAAVGWVISLLERGAASMLRLNELMDAAPDVVDPPAEVAARAAEITGGFRMRGRIEIRDLTFTFPGATAPALINLALDVPEGAALGLTGPVGSGKSTLAAILARRYNPPRGTVFIDGADILDWPLREYRARVGVVDQEPFLFSDAIRANILYGAPPDALVDSGADDRDGAHLDARADTRNTRIMEEACRIARFDVEVASFPRGYNTILGERGINLSGGQRQRAALSRAIALDPALLILDDALAAVDTHTEEEILRGLREFMRGRTTVLISHRVSTMTMADHILYLDAGRVVESGTHEALLALGGRYADLARRQRLAEEIQATA